MIFWGGGFVCVCVCGGAAGVHRAALPQKAPELDPGLLRQLRERCAEQARQLQGLQAQFNRTSLCLDVFSITTQHFCQKVNLLLFHYFTSKTHFFCITHHQSDGFDKDKRICQHSKVPARCHREVDFNASLSQ